MTVSTEGPDPRARSLRPVVFAVLVGVLVLALTLVAIDWARAARCRGYGDSVTDFYRRQSILEQERGSEISRVTEKAALLESVGYPPPGCAFP